MALWSLILDAGAGKLQTVCLITKVLLYNHILIFPGSSDYLTGLFNIHTAI